MESMICKDVVIGWMVVKCKGKSYVRSEVGYRKLYYVIDIVPLTVSCDLVEDSVLDIKPDKEEIVAIIPAMPGTYEVWVYLSDGSCEIIGYEVPGATYPDWESILEALEGKRRAKRKSNQDE